MEEFLLKKNKMVPKTISYSFLDFNGNIVKDKVKMVHTARDTYFISHDDNIRVGKIVNTNGKDEFFIKTIKFGVAGEIVANPLESVVQEAYMDTNTNSKTYEYTLVSQDTFDIYKKYLYTKNGAYFLNVYRRLINGEA